LPRKNLHVAASTGIVWRPAGTPDPCFLGLPMAIKKKEDIETKTGGSKTLWKR
jgi:hypothetical protein